MANADNENTYNNICVQQSNITDLDHEIPQTVTTNPQGRPHSNGFQRRPNRVDAQGNATTPGNIKSRVKYIVLVVIMIVIAVVSSAITAVIIKQDSSSSSETVSPKHDEKHEGSWSSWLEWGDCSATCNVGVRTRNRTCDISGSDEPNDNCCGNEFDISICNQEACIDGGIQCLSCNGVENMTECQQLMMCQRDEECPVSTGSVVRRRLEDTEHCTQCCFEGNICNDNLNCGTKADTHSLERECSDVKSRLPNATSGVYIIYPDGTLSLAVAVYCYIDSNGDAWTAFQRRIDGSVDFYRDWATYKQGFGTPFGEYWIGNDILHELTSYSTHQLKVELTDFDGKTTYANYATFHVGDELSRYIANLTGFNGTVGRDCGTTTSQPINGRKFITYDLENGGCSKNFKGGWWYGGCHCANLNGLYLAGYHAIYGEGINWDSHHYSLKTVTMMIMKTN